MVVALKPGPTVYHLAVTPAEREQLLIAPELGVALGTGEPLATCAGLLAELDAAPLDRLCDALFIAGGAS